MFGCKFSCQIISLPFACGLLFSTLKLEMLCESENTSESKHKCTTVNHTHFPSTDIGVVFMKFLCFFRMISAHNNFAYQWLYKIYSDRRHNQCWRPGYWEGGYKFILDNTRDLFNYMPLGYDVWWLHKDAVMVSPSAVVVRNKRFESHFFFQVGFCNEREHIRESGNQIIFCSPLLNHFKTDSEVVLLRNLLATHK